MIVVQNSTLRRSPYAGIDVKLVGPGVNLHHGLGLDWGLAFASSEYVLICDPDSLICSSTFWPRMRSLVDEHGVASIANGAAQYHPVCLAFRLETWKSHRLSMEQDWGLGYDVAGALTEHLGFREAALLERSRTAGPPMASRRPGKVHHIGEVYEEMFSNTYGSARFHDEDGSIFEGWRRDETVAYHHRWRSWADDIVAGRAEVQDFPTSAR